MVCISLGYGTALQCNTQYSIEPPRICLNLELSVITCYFLLQILQSNEDAKAVSRRTKQDEHLTHI